MATTDSTTTTSELTKVEADLVAVLDANGDNVPDAADKLGVTAGHLYNVRLRAFEKLGRPVNRRGPTGTGGMIDPRAMIQRQIDALDARLVSARTRVDELADQSTDPDAIVAREVDRRTKAVETAQAALDALKGNSKDAKEARDQLVADATEQGTAKLDTARSNLAQVEVQVDQAREALVSALDAMPVPDTGDGS